MQDTYAMQPILSYLSLLNLSISPPRMGTNRITFLTHTRAAKNAFYKFVQMQTLVGDNKFPARLSTLFEIIVLLGSIHVIILISLPNIITE